MYTVSNLEDAGPGSLRDAILAANQSAGIPDEIQFSTTGEIRLASELPTIVDDLTIAGPGEDQLTINAGNGADGLFATADGFRIFTIDDGSFQFETSVVLRGMTLTGGDTLAGASGRSGLRGTDGGAVWSSELLTVEQVVFRGNATGPGGDASQNRSQAGPGGDGGALFNYAGTLIMNDCTVVDNRTGDGGATTGSYAQAGNGGSGGGVLSVFGQLFVNNCLIAGNVTGDGGAASGYHGFAGWGGAGGGVANFAGDLTLTVSVVDNNRTGDGGAALNATGVTQFGGRGGGGGGVVNEAGFATIEETAITNNTTGDGGAGNTYNGSGGWGGHGGGLYSNQGQVTISRAEISGNRTGAGGESTDTFGLGGEGGYGGGIFLYQENISLTDSTVGDNLAGAGGAAPGPGGFGGAGGAGGGVYALESDLEVLTSTFSGNEAGAAGAAPVPGLPGAGGGLYYSAPMDDPSLLLRIWRSTISGNASATSGGGVYNESGKIVIEESTITANTAAAGSGAGLASVGSDVASTTVGGSIVSGNLGGGIPGSDVDIVLGNSNSYDSDGYNLVGSGSATNAFFAQGDSTGITAPLLGPLANNGGPNQTHEVLPGSPALDRGDPSASGNGQHDQRGAPFNRLADGGTGENRQDIGAFERQPQTIYQPGDYNQDGFTNAADYTLWRDSLGSTSDLRANGDDQGASQGVIDEADYLVWSEGYGGSAEPPAAAPADPDQKHAVMALNRASPSRSGEVDLAFSEIAPSAPAPATESALAMEALQNRRAAETALADEVELPSDLAAEVFSNDSRSGGSFGDAPIGRTKWRAF